MKADSKSKNPLTPLPAARVLDAYFLEARSKLLDLAAALDRIGRGKGANEAANDPRLAKIREALAMLADDTAAKAGRVQRLFSLDYDSDWQKEYGLNRPLG